MIRSIYLDPRFEKQLRLLRKAGKKGALAATQADAIVGQLHTGGTDTYEVGTTTRHGELRIKGCIKFDLGSGYRMITLKRGTNLFILYIGTHDDCDRWIENNRDLPMEMIQERSRRVCVRKTTTRRRVCETKAFNDEQDDMAEPDDRCLRIIFSGLVQPNPTIS